jgi:hypothetical protein
MASVSIFLNDWVEPSAMLQPLQPWHVGLTRKRIEDGTEFPQHMHVSECTLRVVYHAAWHRSGSTMLVDDNA